MFRRKIQIYIVQSLVMTRKYIEIIQTIALKQTFDEFSEILSPDVD